MRKDPVHQNEPPSTHTNPCDICTLQILFEQGECVNTQDQQNASENYCNDNKSNNLFVKFQLMQQFQFHVGVMLKVPKKAKKCGGLFQI